MSQDPQITVLLQELRSGNENVLEELIPIVYGELRRLAAGYLRRERVGHTLQPTALVNEAYLKLVDKEIDWQNRAHFFGVAARSMREILIDHARRRNMQKRGGLATHISFDEAYQHNDESAVDLLKLNEALESLEAADPRQAKIVEMKFFAGLTLEEIAEATSMSVSTVRRDWTTAKMFLARFLQ
ncbi:MAG: sigma-70 family RNA polymerase sigma factor [Pyrinomonadaceae bacterium]